MIKNEMSTIKKGLTAKSIPILWSNKTIDGKMIIRNKIIS